MEALMYVVFGVFLLLFYSIGFSVGQRVIKKEESTPIAKKIVNAITNKNDETSESYAEDEDDEISKVLHNIEVYDGTGKGQIDV